MTAPPRLLEGKGRRAFVAGASGGIGRSVTDVFTSAGARVAGTARDSRNLPAKTADFLPLAMNPVSEDSVAKALDDAAAAFGGLDFVISMIGMVGAGPLADMTAEDWQAVLDVNLTSCFYLAKHAHPHLKRSRGTLVLCSSTNGLNGGSRLSGAAYAVAKAGILNLNRYLAKEWAADGIRVNCVAPGPVETPMLDRLSDDQHAALKAGIPLGTYASADQVARAVAFLCSDAAATMTGTVMNISAGLVLD